VTDQAIPTIEGGSTSEDRSPPIEVKGPFDVDKYRGALTFTLVGLLAIILIGHYLCLLVLEWNGKKLDGVTTAFNTALPVVSGLAGSAVTYYFTRGDHPKPTK
jgi:hypothetical protein